MRVLVARHGRTAANAQGRLLGRADPQLDGTGLSQAGRLAALLAGESVGRIVSSPLLRCRQTAGIVAASCGLTVEVDDRWVELDYGDLDGRPLSEVPGDLWDRWRSDAAFVPAGGESLLDLGVRVRAALDELREAGGPSTVLVVTHVSPLKAAVAWALGVGDEVAWRMFVAPASVTRIEVGERGPSLVGFNDTSHL